MVDSSIIVVFLLSDNFPEYENFRAEIVYLPARNADWYYYIELRVFRDGAAADTQKVAYLLDAISAVKVNIRFGSGHRFRRFHQ